ncbi:MAG: hypothetical protein ABJ308_16890 [Halieaceae bacterium]
MTHSPLVHIGYHKTASSWLQQALLPALSAQVSLFDHPQLWDELMLPSGLVFDAGRCKSYLDGLVAQARQEGKLAVFSSERLSGNPHSGGYDAAEMANRIRACFDEVRLLIVVREQNAILASNYKQYIKMGGTCTLEEYLTPPWDGRVPHFRLDNFRYHHLLEYYCRLFGADKVLVLPYELLRQRPQQFADTLIEHMGLEPVPLAPAVFEQGVNVSMNDLQLRLKRWANKLSGNDSLHPVKPLAPALANWCFQQIEKLGDRDFARNHSMRIAPRVEAVVGDYYADSNRQLQAYVAADLSALGYRV